MEWQEIERRHPALTMESEGGGPEVRRLHIVSDISCRFAQTEVASCVANDKSSAVETEFLAVLPNAAFITYFEMELNGKVIVGDVKEKQKAKEVYDAAKQRGETAGHIEQQPRETNSFRISVNIEAHSEARFKLVYQELLQRVRGVYKHHINVQPKQKVGDLQVDVHIRENGAINVLHVPKFAPKLSDRSHQQLLYYEKADDVSIEKEVGATGSKIHVQWRPSLETQTKLMEQHESLDGQLVVLYDVERPNNTGEIQVVNGHFIHFFAPSGIPVGSKHVVFALDISGSMSGTKLSQTKDAMVEILQQLREEDSFNVLCFDTSLDEWKPKGSVYASSENIEDAKTYVRKREARGGTDMNIALQKGIEWLSAGNQEVLAKILIILTDGQHNSGPFEKTSVVNIACKERIKIYGLGFGRDADFDLLKRISAETGGLARKIYVDSDAAVQLQSFYEEISSPLLSALNIKYLDPSVDPDSIVRSQVGDTLFEGGELVIAGQLSNLSLEDQQRFGVRVEATGRDGPVNVTGNALPPDLVPIGPLTVVTSSRESGTMAKSVGEIVERSWAYLTVKDLLAKSELSDDHEETEKLKQRALNLALKFRFVTRLTSMVVTQDAKALEAPTFISPEEAADFIPARRHMAEIHTHFPLKCKKSMKSSSFLANLICQSHKLSTEQASFQLSKKKESFLPRKIRETYRKALGQQGSKKEASFLPLETYKNASIQQIAADYERRFCGTAGAGSSGGEKVWEVLFAAPPTAACAALTTIINAGRIEGAAQLHTQPDPTERHLIELVVRLCVERLMQPPVPPAEFVVNALLNDKEQGSSLRMVIDRSEFAVEIRGESTVVGSIMEGLDVIYKVAKLTGHDLQYQPVYDFLQQTTKPAKEVDDMSRVEKLAFDLGRCIVAG